MPNITRWSRGERRPAWWRLDPFEMMRNLMPTYGGGEGETFVPAFDVKDTTDAYLFKADVPGFADKDIDITLTGNMLTISGKREAEEREEGETYYLYEREYGSFSRSFTLPEGVDPDGVSASLEHGVLTVRIAKRAEAQPKKVQIKGAIGAAVDKVKGVLGRDKDKSTPVKA